MRRFAIMCFASVLAVGGLHAEEPRDAVMASCSENTNMPEGLCDCFADLAAEELSPEGQSYLAVLMRGDRAAADAMRSSVPQEDQVTAPLFMVSGPQRCM